MNVCTVQRIECMQVETKTKSAVEVGERGNRHDKIKLDILKRVQNLFSFSSSLVVVWATFRNTKRSVPSVAFELLAGEGGRFFIAVTVFI